MKVVFSERFLEVYTTDPAAEAGRLEAVLDVIGPHVELIDCQPCDPSDLEVVHTKRHIESVKEEGLFDIASLAAGGAIKTAEIGLNEPCFGLIRPPGHHASKDGYWGFCYFNNMAVAVRYLMKTQKLNHFFILDFDLHYGDGTVNIFAGNPNVKILNPSGRDRKEYLSQISNSLKDLQVEMICVSAGFDNHQKDWGGLLFTEDYYEIGTMLHQKAKSLNIGCFALLEGGYNHHVLGHNVLAFLKGFNGL